MFEADEMESREASEEKERERERMSAAAPVVMTPCRVTNPELKAVDESSGRMN